MEIHYETSVVTCFEVSFQLRDFTKGASALRDSLARETCCGNMEEKVGFLCEFLTESAAFANGPWSRPNTDVGISSRSCQNQRVIASIHFSHVILFVLVWWCQLSGSCRAERDICCDIIHAGSGSPAPDHFSPAFLSVGPLMTDWTLSVGSQIKPPQQLGVHYTRVQAK
jgi:hypothetical protein